MRNAKESKLPLLESPIILHCPCCAFLAISWTYVLSDEEEREIYCVLVAGSGPKNLSLKWLPAHLNQPIYLSLHKFDKSCLTFCVISDELFGPIINSFFLRWFTAAADVSSAQQWQDIYIEYAKWICVGYSDEEEAARVSAAAIKEYCSAFWILSPTKLDDVVLLYC